MASVFKKGNKIYISWYDPIQGKRLNKSTKLDYNPGNLSKAKEAAKRFQQTLDKQSDLYSVLGIKKISIKSAFEHFLRVNSSKHPKTIIDYKRFYKYFTKQFDENQTCMVINKLSIEDWLIEIKKLPMQPNSIFAIFKQYRHFLNFLFEYSYVPMFKINRSIQPKAEIKEKIIMSEQDIKKIFDSLDNKNTNFSTFIYLAFYTGLRASDLLSIKGDHIDLERRELRYYSPKRKIYREVGFHKFLVPILRNRIEEVGDGKLLNYNNVENLGMAMRRFLKQIELNGKHYSSRTFRKTFITMCRRYGMDPSVVAELVGHEHQSTTDKYYNKIEIQQMLDELEKFQPLFLKKKV